MIAASMYIAPASKRINFLLDIIVGIIAIKAGRLTFGNLFKIISDDIKYLPLSPEDKTAAPFLLF